MTLEYTNEAKSVRDLYHKLLKLTSRFYLTINQLVDLIEVHLKGLLSKMIQYMIDNEMSPVSILEAVSEATKLHPVVSPLDELDKIGRVSSKGGIREVISGVNRWNAQMKTLTLSYLTKFHQ